MVITTHGSHTLSVLASTIFFEPCEVGCHLDVPIRAEHSIVSHFFFFGQLYISALITI